MNRLIDAKKPLIFEITQPDIAMAKRYDREYCVIANALRDTLGITTMYVGSKYTHIECGEKRLRYKTPIELGLALKTFDDTGYWGLPIGVYRLNAPLHSLSLAYCRQYNGKLKNPNYKPNPLRVGSHTMRAMSSRVIEFAKIRQQRRKLRKAA